VKDRRPRLRADVAPAEAAAKLFERLVRVAALRTPAKPGGEYRARTGDPLVANQVLSQLS
jgi:hypothetical protein